ncbi:uncharacterized protein BDR25DRAFT_298104 [Lindgomyces ingoldianus]|uniref:Uncharacterized protein n=1 Tax=Lindgomyces ingoldianus TaxID=673940 RepID=A0ACB6Q8S6_9PLEO|nr:uncharacterized protein BDR25DRAFT_298104 [Lindgomyces ingoldianus]KAF2463324.1 hypothetical protein BDR25DRAFT_298104 [Lindgomyces ingoldianus]
MAPPTGVNGVLPVTVLQKNAPASAPRGPKAASPRLKLVLRRLPPGLTKTEFETALGDEWKPGSGKVDWMVYKKGKISKDAAKPSRPSRAYFHVISQSHVTPLGDHVRQASFNDAAKSHQDNALIGPPVLEFSPYHRIPGGRRRNDARQGLIDQDQEFKDFLESLTNPVTKPSAVDVAEGHKEEKVTTTPLIEALREKKANKDKPSKTAAKHGRGESKEDPSEKKILAKAGKDAASASGDKSRRLSKAEKAAKEAVKVLNKEASASKDGTLTSTEKTAPGAPSPAPERKRGNVSIAKSMLQRDLGLGPGPNRRRGTKREVTPAVQESGLKSEETTAGKQKGKEAPALAAAAAALITEKTAPTSPKKENPRPTRAERRAYKASLADITNSNKTPGENSKAQAKAAPPAPTILKKPQGVQIPTTPKGSAATRVPPTEPAATRAPASQPQSATAKSEISKPSRPQAPTASQSSAASPVPTPTGRQAFLKHANASQGITEPLIEEALKAFGAIEKVEIDKRKGFAYVDFVEAESLQKAIAASPVRVAQGAVQVLERKEKVVRRQPHPGPHGPPTGPARGGRGGFPGRGRGRGGARGGGHVAAAPTASASDTVAAPPTTSAAPAPAPPAISEAAT